MTSVRRIPRTVKNDTLSRMVRALLATLFLTFAIGVANSEAASENKADNAKLDERIMHSRAFESVIWSVPLMNYTAMRNGYKKGAGVDYNDVVYHSKVQTWELEIPTGNNTTPYIIAYWTVKDGPVVVEIPGGTKDVSLFGGMMYLSSAYHSPLEVTGNVLLSLSVYKTLSNPNISRSPVTPRKVW